MIDPAFLHTLTTHQLDIAISRMERALATAREIQARKPATDTRPPRLSRDVLSRMVEQNPEYLTRLGDTRRRRARDRQIIALAALLPTQSAVADALNVHPSTVSRVLKKQQSGKK
ncbi:MAG: helix-turn-helix domain-containing protein [Thalassobaculaceae bacterium]